MKKTILAALTIAVIDGLVLKSVDKSAPRPVKSYPTTVRLILVGGAAVILACARPFIENQILGESEPAKLFGMDILS